MNKHFVFQLISVYFFQINHKCLNSSMTLPTLIWSQICLSAGTTAPRMPQGRREVYLWAAVLASTTPAECIQERTASGSSFRLAVAPRGRLSWIPNISWVPQLQPPQHDHRNKRHEEKTRLKKKSLAENKSYWTDRADGLLTDIRTSEDEDKKKKKNVSTAGSDPEFEFAAELLVRFNSTFNSRKIFF